MTHTRKEKKTCRAPFHVKASQKGFIFFLESEWNHIYILRFQHHFWELKGKTPSCPVPVPVPVLFLPLNGSFSPKALHFSSSAQIVLVGLIKNHFLLYNSTLTIRVSLRQIFYPDKTLVSAGRMEAFFIQSVRACSRAGLFPVQKSKLHIHRCAKIFSPHCFHINFPVKSLNRLGVDFSVKKELSFLHFSSTFIGCFEPKWPSQRVPSNTGFYI